MCTWVSLRQQKSALSAACGGRSAPDNTGFALSLMQGVCNAASRSRHADCSGSRCTSRSVIQTATMLRQVAIVQYQQPDPSTCSLTCDGYNVRLAAYSCHTRPPMLRLQLEVLERVCAGPQCLLHHSVQPRLLPTATAQHHNHVHRNAI